MPEPSVKHCQVCRVELPPEHSGPICPACMLEQGLGEDTRVATVEIRPGSKIQGYEIIRKIGVGGMGVVYEARKKTSRRSVALKMVKAPGAATAKDIARFRQEAEAAARLSHPNIVEVYEIGEHEGSPFFTMKYVEGARSLGIELAKGPFEPRAAAKLVREIARAVAYAHRRGVIHRDLKLANILLDAGGRPCLVDFGLAKLFGQTPSMVEMVESLSDQGLLLGTLPYMSPEQVRGEDITTSTDVYSLGVVLYELLTGSPPFRGRGLNDIIHGITEVTPKLPALSGRRMPRHRQRDLQAVCLACLRKNPANRFYGTADELADDLQRWIDGRPVKARPSSLANRFKKWALRNPAVATLSPIVVFLAVVATVLGIVIWKGWEERAEGKVRNGLYYAMAERAGNQAGRRWRARGYLTRAADWLKWIDESEKNAGYRKDLQNEAIWCLSLIDLRPSEAAHDSWRMDSPGDVPVRLSPDFTDYAQVTEGGGIVVCDRGSGEVLLKALDSASAPCVNFRFDSRGLRLAVVRQTGDADYRVAVWDLVSREKIAIDATGGAKGTDLSANGPDAFDFSADGSLAIARGKTVAIVPRDADSATRELSLPFAAGIVRVDRDGELIAASPSEGTGAVLFDFVTGAIVDEFKGPFILDLAWNPRGRWLAMSCDTRVVIWDTDPASAPANRELSLYTDEMRASFRHIAWHPRGVLIAGTSNTGKIHLWHAVRGKLEVTYTAMGEVDRPQFSPNGDRLGSVVNGGEVSLLEVAEGRVVSHARGHPGHIYGAWWREAGKGRIFATAGDDGVRIWNRRGFEKAYIPEPGARAALFTKECLIITGRNGVTVRSVRGGGSLDTSSEVSIGPPLRFAAETSCHGADYHAEQRELAVATGDAVEVFYLADREKTLTPIVSLPAPAGTAYVDMSDDGLWLAAGTEGGNAVRVWKRESGGWSEFKNDFPVTGSAKVVFYTDPYTEDEWFVISGGSHYLFYNLKTWERHPCDVPANLDKAHGAIGFSPRTPVFAVSEAGKIRIYDLHQFRPLVNPEFEFQEPVCFSPVGFILMTADQKSHLHLWNLRLLRESLDEMNLDLTPLRPFPVTSELPLIDTVEVEKEPAGSPP